MRTDVMDPQTLCGTVLKWSSLLHQWLFILQFASTVGRIQYLHLWTWDPYCSSTPNPPFCLLFFVYACRPSSPSPLFLPSLCLFSFLCICINHLSSCWLFSRPSAPLSFVLTVSPLCCLFSFCRVSILLPSLWGFEPSFFFYTYSFFPLQLFFYLSSLPHTWLSSHLALRQWVPLSATLRILYFSLGFKLIIFVLWFCLKMLLAFDFGLTGYMQPLF